MRRFLLISMMVVAVSATAAGSGLVAASGQSVRPLFVGPPPVAAPNAIPDVKWERIAIGGQAPDRALHGMIYDPVNQSFWSFGGVEADAQSNRFRNDVYRLDATDPDAKWVRQSIGGQRPQPLAFHTVTYDPVRNRMIVYGGLLDRQDSSQKPTDGNSVWFLGLSDPGKLEWTREHVTGNPTDRFAHAAVYVPGIDALIVSGGAETFDDSTSSNYALLLGEEPMRWVRLANAGFSARLGHAIFYDEVGARLLVYGGIDNLSDVDGIRELIQLDVSAGLTKEKRWSRVTTATPGMARGLMATAFDPRSRLLWVHGGIEANNKFSRDLSVLDLNPDRPVWTRTQEVLNGPLDRFGHTAALDVPRNRIVFQGGTPDNAITLRDTRSLKLGSPPVPTAPASATLPPTAETPVSTETPSTPSVTATPSATQGSPEPTTPTPTATGDLEKRSIYLPVTMNGHSM